MIRNLLLFMLLLALGVAAAMLLGWLPVSTQNIESMAPSSDGGAGSAPTNSFVVCPGHPRCPKGANDDKTEAPREGY